ncbi:MAG TPA: YihY/virulence factor BrkB family protein [Dehalococcoidia bacterium]|nr:YihY/virulence factor BrkB family protein [Dehalococcoidia bacterium]
MKALFRFVQQTGKGYGEARGASFAAAIAYSTLFSIFPMAVFLVAFAGYFMSDSQRNSLVDKLTSALGGGSTANVREQVMAATSGRASLGIIALVGALWSGSAVFTAIRTGLNVIWQRQQKSPWVVQKIKDLSAVFGLAIMLSLSIAATALLTVVTKITEQVLGKDAGGIVAYPLGLLLIVAPLGIVFLAFGVLYAWASPPHMHWRDVWPGALFAAAGFVVLSFGFSLYARYFGHFDKVYGTLGAVIAFLFYAYLIGTLILMGAEVVEQYVLLKHGDPLLAAPAGRLLQSGAGAVDGRGQRQIPLLVLVTDDQAAKRGRLDTITAAQAFPRAAESFETAEPAGPAR